MARIIKRGDVWIVNLEPGFGREIHKKRPALVISNESLHQIIPHVVVIPSSSIVPHVISRDLVFVGKIKGFSRESVLLPMFIRSIDQARLVEKIGTISKEKLSEVEDALKLVLGMIELD